MSGQAITRKDLLEMEERQSGRLTELEERQSKRTTEMEERLFNHIVAHVDERIERTETKLLTAFHGWARSM